MMLFGGNGFHVRFSNRKRLFGLYACHARLSRGLPFGWCRSRGRLVNIKTIWSLVTRHAATMADHALVPHGSGVGLDARPLPTITIPLPLGTLSQFIAAARGAILRMAGTCQ